MKLNRHEADTLFNLVTQEVRRVSDKRREYLSSDDERANSDPLRRELQQLQLLRIKLDRFRKQNTLKQQRRKG